MISPSDYENISSTGFSIFEITTVVGTSLLLAIVLWNIISNALESTPDQKIFQFLLEAVQLWLCILLFMVAVVVCENIFSTLLKEDFVLILVTPDMIVDVIWIDIILVSLFYTVIGFQAIRKIWRYDSVIRRFIIDYSQIMLISVELALLAAAPADWPGLTYENIDFPLYYFYVILIIVLVVEAFWWFDQQVKTRRDISGRKYSFNIVIMQIMGIFLPLSVFTFTLPTPLFILLVNFFLLLATLLVFLLISVFTVLVYDLLAMVGISTRVTQMIDTGTQPLRFKVSSALASRGAIFNYPMPTDILSGDEPSERPIDYRTRKVRLKMACGQCFHVFNVVTDKSGLKGTLPVFPCPVCGSVATTPIWE